MKIKIQHLTEAASAMTPQDAMTLIKARGQRLTTKDAPGAIGKDIAAQVVAAYNAAGEKTTELFNKWFKVTDLCDRLAGDNLGKLQDAMNAVVGNETDAGYNKYLAAGTDVLAWRAVYYNTLYRIFDTKIQ